MSPGVELLTFLIQFYQGTEKDQSSIYRAP